MRIRAEGEVLNGDTLNISLGLHGLGYLHIEGRVVWARNLPGRSSEAGLTFEKMEPRTREIISGYLA
jgi:hypothetical protein